MQRRVKIPKPSPLTFASRSLTAQAAGNVKELEDEFKADKAVKDSKIATLESDKNDKDSRVAALESDKNDKDTKMSDMESDIESLTTRVAALETLGISGISNAVSWTNLTEINLSGEKLTNGDFSSSGYVQDTSFCLTQTCGLQPNNGHINDHTFAEADRPKIIALQTTSSAPLITAGDIYRIKGVNTVSEAIYIETLDGVGLGWTYGGLRGTVWEVVDKVPTNWSVLGGTLDQTKLAQGIIKGSGGAVAIQQTFSQNIVSGTKLIVKVTSDDDIKFTPIKTNGQIDLNNDFTVLGSDDYAEHTTQTDISGFKVGTVNGLREFSSISIFQGEVSGGTVQAYAGGGLEKISGGGAYNAGASSVQKIDGNSDGYVQFQLAFSDKSLKVGLVNLDHDFSVDPPWAANFGGGFVDFFSPYISNHTAVSSGDWFRIRHYAADNKIHFQRKQKIYEEDADFCLLQTCGLMPNNGHSTDHTFTTESRPLIKAKQTANGLTEGEYYRIHAVNTSTLHVNVYTTSGVWVGWMQDRGTHWQVQKELGEDYVTFYNHPLTTNGSDLYVDVSFFSVGARINDVTIVT